MISHARIEGLKRQLNEKTERKKIVERKRIEKKERAASMIQADKECDEKMMDMISTIVMNNSINQ